MADKQTVKVGDKVLSKYSCHSGGYDIGDVFTVTKVDGDFIGLVDKNGSDRLRSSDEFDILPVADATGKPAFKVGDRVVALKDSAYSIKKGSISTVVRVDGDYISIRKENGTFDGWRAEYFALALFTIETGKFYRTRDGRKVGPMSDEGDRAYDTDEKCLAAYINGDHRLFRAKDGRHLFGKAHLDLIAEWVDEPLATASTDAASDDNAPVAKFKVGDIVKRSGSFMPHQRLRITKVLGDRYSVEWLEGGPGSIDNWRGYEFELAGPTSQPAIVAMIENGQPKPSEKPKVHKSEESATDEAERLAVKYPGQKFGVFVLADSRIADVVIRRAA
ncbi:hypothetical protein [Brucella intermedia]|uniref:hypothetical protein n=1 Tax=Brucella intermedia TaxID=94625 RepID=UPI00124D8EC4|nr:hypothetical protein [Brucella intermedia]KAB2716635.1 hypothetical protein F9K75_11095 [Brucella intermedia]